MLLEELAGDCAGIVALDDFDLGIVAEGRVIQPADEGDENGIALP